MLLMKGAPPEEVTTGKAPPKKKKRDLEDVEYMGIAGSESRLVIKKPALAVDEEMTVSKTLFARLNATGQGSKLQIRADLTDMHIFILSRWALDVAAHSGKFPSLKSDLIPMLIRKQFHPTKPIATPQTSSAKPPLAPHDRSKEGLVTLLASGNTRVSTHTPPIICILPF